jgi:hypothetical protein
VANQRFIRISSFLISLFTQYLNQFLMYDTAGIRDTILVYL